MFPLRIIVLVGISSKHLARNEYYDYNNTNPEQWRYIFLVVVVAPVGNILMLHFDSSLSSEKSQSNGTKNKRPQININFLSLVTPAITPNCRDVGQYVLSKPFAFLNFTVEVTRNNVLEFAAQCRNLAR